ncbi:MAG: protein translocase subunit SecF [Burkholderiaceae bacterium]|nr:MAG: protein translocase subunit SecF [Burkholderiaceae bacterium]
MEFFRIKNDIPFMRHALKFNIFSLLTFLAAIFFLIHSGLNLSVEFTGGVNVVAHYSGPVNVDAVRAKLQEQGIKDPQTQKFGNSQDVLIRFSLKELELPSLATGGKIDTEKLTANVLQAGGADASIQNVEFVGPQIGAELLNDGLLALLFVVMFIMAYLALRFEWKFAVAAIVANLHDVVIILGFFAFFHWEFSLPVLAAVLAVLGYSVNESVVIADRIRENFKKMRKAEVEHVIDNAITSTISRTIITHGTTQTMVLFMLIFGGPTLHGFALALTIGICFGIYSSVLVMAPITKWLGISREDLVQPVKKEQKEETYTL